PGRNGEEPAAGHELAQDLVEAHTRLAAQQATLGVEGDEAAEPGHIEQGAIFVETAIAVTAPKGIGEHTTRQVGEIRDLRAPGDGYDPPWCNARIASPRWIVCCGRIGHIALELPTCFRPRLPHRVTHRAARH